MNLLNKLKILQNNPRRISKDQFEKLKKSLNEFQEMLLVRPIVYDEDFTIWGGNQRFRAYKMLVEQGVLEYNADYFKKLPDNWTLKQKKEFAIKDNSPEGMSGTFDFDILANEWSELDLEDFGLDLRLETENPYTAKITSPTYEITGIKPQINELVDLNKLNELQEKIRKSNVSEEIKEFLLIASYRHAVFHYENIAEFYAHMDKETQELFEDNALIIIDFNKAIEQGYIELSEEIIDTFNKDYGN